MAAGGKTKAAKEDEMQIWLGTKGYLAQGRKFSNNIWESLSGAEEKEKEEEKVEFEILKPVLLVNIVVNLS